MKKQTIILVIIAFIIVLLVKDKSENLIIPKEAIRIRIISNSNDSLDIEEKMQVKKNVEKEIYNLLKSANSIEEAREIINQNLDKLNITIEDTTNRDYSISFGNNYFPRKTYKGVIYDEGIYESLVISLGEAQGDNWWCVLFPPLCLLDGNEETEDVEYKFFVKELIDKYF
ncbi:MAG: stage II sporulation protein R [Bacilli bacterium]|nr:stage II sporulation protein R [Bacilli bacterium]